MRKRILSAILQAMDLISVAQRTGEVSAEAYSEAYHESNGALPPPQMAGIEEMVERMHLADAESNPFHLGGGSDATSKAVDGAYAGAPSPGPGGQFRPPAIIPPAPSPPRSVVSFHYPSPMLHCTGITSVVMHWWLLITVILWLCMHWAEGQMQSEGTAPAGLAYHLHVLQDGLESCL